MQKQPLNRFIRVKHVKSLCHPLCGGDSLSKLIQIPTVMAPDLLIRKS